MLSKRLSTMLLSGAAVAGLGASVANAGLLIDVRAFSVNGSTAAVTNPKSLVVAPGNTVIFRVFAQVTGADANLPDCLQSLSGSFLSTGSLQGGLAVQGITAPFNAAGSSSGAVTDLDGDGDADVGSNNDVDPTGFFAVRSALLSGPRSSNDTGGSVYPAGAGPTAIPGGTEYRIVTTLRFVVGAGGGETLVNFRKRTSNTFGVWAQDATEVASDVFDPDGNPATQYTYTGGTSFTSSDTVLSGLPVLLVVPEPASLGLAALAGLGMLARRRK